MFVPVISFRYADDVLIQLYFIGTDYLYIVYSNIVDSYYRPAIKYQFRSEQKAISNKLKTFAIGGLWSDKYCKDESVTSYIDESLISKERQESIIYWYVNDLADLGRYYEDGVQYSGYIKKYYGEYGIVPDINPEPLSIIMVELNEEVYEPIERVDTIDGVVFEYKDTNQIYCNNGGNFYTLQEAFDHGYITHADLVAISEIHNN